MGFFEQEKPKEKKENSLWCEKWRPDTLSEYVGNEHLKEKVGDYIESEDIPHLLFYGKAGTGKTTLARLIMNSIKCDYIVINASDERGIDTIRTKIKGFASTIGFQNMKIILLDEADYLTPDAQASLRNVMETFSQHCRFILTCNYAEKIIPAIQSRCQSFQIVPPTKKDVAIQVNKILTAENIQFELKDLVPIIDSAYPDIRKIINTCQSNSKIFTKEVDGKRGLLKVNVGSILESDVKSKIVDILKSNLDVRNKYVNSRQAVADARLQDFTEIYTYLYEKVDEFAKSNTSSIILLLAEGQYKDALVVDKEIVFMATLIGIIGAIG